MRTIGGNIRELRESAGLTQTELANKLHVSDGAVSAWESGRIQPKTQRVSALASALDCSIRDVYKGTVYEVLFGGASAFEQDPPRTLPKTSPPAPAPFSRTHFKPTVSKDGKSIRVDLKPVKAYELTDQEVRLIAYYRIMSKAAQSAILTMAKASAGGGNESDETAER